MSTVNNFRTALSRFIWSSRDLCIETGRYKCPCVYMYITMCMRMSPCVCVSKCMYALMGAYVCPMCV